MSEAYHRCHLHSRVTIQGMLHFSGWRSSSRECPRGRWAWSGVAMEEKESFMQQEGRGCSSSS